MLPTGAPMTRDEVRASSVGTQYNQTYSSSEIETFGIGYQEVGTNNKIG